MESTVDLPNIWQKLLLSSGILAPLLYLGTDWLAGRLLKGYSFAAQSMSELSATGASTRTLVVWLTLVACIFMVAFGVGVWRAAGQAILPRIVGGLLIANAVTGLVATTFFPTRFGVRPVFGSAGVMLMFVSVLCFVLAMVFAALAFGGWLRLLSIAVPLSYVLLAVFRFATASAATAGGAGSLMGTQERTMAYSFLAWVIALAVYLLLLSRQGFVSAGS
jgi:hypothetical protein